MTGILTSVLRMEGFLRWNYCVWTDDPRKDIRYSYYEAGITDFEMLEQIRATKGRNAKIVRK